MSETAVETPAPTGDAFGALPPPAVDAAPEPAPAEAAEQPPAAEAPVEEPAWWAAYGNTEEEAAERIRNIDHLRGRQANEIGEMRSRLEALETRQPPQAPAETPAAAPAAEQIFTEQELAELRELAEDYPNLAQRLYDDRVEQIEFQQAVAQGFQPLYETTNKTIAEQTLAKLKGEFGDEMVLAHAATIGEQMKADHGHFLDPETRYHRLRQAFMAAEYERMQSPQQPRTEDGRFAPAPTVSSPNNVHVEGGSTPAPPAAVQPDDPDAQIKAAIRGQGRRDSFGEVRPLAPEEG